MNLLEIKKYPQKLLRQNCDPVNKVTKQEARLLRQMLITMNYFKGIGLAAPQIGIPLRLIVADIGNGPIRLANPQTLKVSGREIKHEGCLSIPEAAVKIERPHKVTVKGINHKGKIIEIEADGLLARVLQHEIDHLSGRLIIDYMPFLPRIRFKLKRRFN